MSPIRYGLLSDTHGNLHSSLFDVFHGVDAIFHAGDVMGDSVLVELETIAPTYAVAGNCDRPGAVLPLLRVEELPFGKLVMAHGHLIDASIRNPEGLARHFASEGPRVIVFGHTHLPLAEEREGIWVVNPGSACKPRLQDRPSVAVMTWDEVPDQLSFKFYPIDWRRP